MGIFGAGFKGREGNIRRRGERKAWKRRASKGNLSLLLFPEERCSRPTGTLPFPGGGPEAGPAHQVAGVLGAARLPSNSQVADEATDRGRDAPAVRAGVADSRL